MAQYLIVRERLNAAGARRRRSTSCSSPIRRRARCARSPTSERIPGARHSADRRRAVQRAHAGRDAAGGADRDRHGGAARRRAATSRSAAPATCSAKNPAGIFATLQCLADTKLGRHIHVLMPYSDPLRDIADWFVQLWAESLGKHRSRGRRRRRPDAARRARATDQHSKVQLFMEGPRRQDGHLHRRRRRAASDVTIPQLHADVKELGYLGGHRLGELLTSSSGRRPARWRGAGGRT